MRKIRIGMLVMMCIATVFLCGIFAYGMAGHNIYRGFHGVYNNGNTNMHLVLEKEVSLDKINSISVSYNMNSNDIYLYESTDNTLIIKEYYSAGLSDNEVSTVTVSGSSLVIKGKKRNNYGLYYNGGYTEIWLPASYNGELLMSTSSGDISSDMDIALKKDLLVETSSGDVMMPNVSAINVSIACSSGCVNVKTIDTDIEGNVGKVNISTSSGDIALDQITGKTTIGSSSGYVKVKTITGNAGITTSSGDITVQCIDGNAEIGASSGYVKIYNGSGERSISTNSGDVLLEGVDKPWNVKTTSGYVNVTAQKGNGTIGTSSGDIILELSELTGNLDIRSNSGDVSLKLSGDNAFDFTADTTSGDIDTFFDDDLSFSKKGNSAHGSYGNSAEGNKIKISTTSGDVRITEH